MEVKQVIIGRSLAETPTWSVVTVITALVAVGALVHRSIHRFGKWVAKTKRKALLSALEKIKEELMLFGLLSFLLGHWTVWIAEICTKSSSFSTRFYPCSENTYDGDMMHVKHVSANLYSRNHSVFREEEIILQRGYCPEGYEPFVSYDSLGQLRRFLFVLGITHVSYSSFTVALAMLKIYSWRTWESQAKSMAIQSLEGEAVYFRLNFFIHMPERSSYIVMNFQISQLSVENPIVNAVEWFVTAISRAQQVFDKMPERSASRFSGIFDSLERALNGFLANVEDDEYSPTVEAQLMILKGNPNQISAITVD